MGVEVMSLIFDWKALVYEVNEVYKHLRKIAVLGFAMVTMKDG